MIAHINRPYTMADLCFDERLHWIPNLSNLDYNHFKTQLLLLLSGSSINRGTGNSNKIISFNLTILSAINITKTQNYMNIDTYTRGYLQHKRTTAPMHIPFIPHLTFDSPTCAQINRPIQNWNNMPIKSVRISLN